MQAIKEARAGARRARRSTAYRRHRRQQRVGREAEPAVSAAIRKGASRGRAGYEKYRREFAKLIWQIASPKWQFDEATFERSASAFDNPDHVAISIHNYRWRLGLAEGEARYDELERKLAQLPSIEVPTITLEGDANGAPHPEPSAYANKFIGHYEHRRITGGIGHNLPQEAPRAFAQAIVDVDRF